MEKASIELERYRQAVEYVEGFSNSSIRKNKGAKKKDPSFYLDRTRYFLDFVGAPYGALKQGQKRGPKYIHVTGTAGKGSTSTMLQEMLVVAGHTTGLFTSPYVTTAAEKIRVDGKYISGKIYAELVDFLKPYVVEAQNGPYGGPSAFELSLAIALLYFERMKCEWVVLEVGLGGRYDATNVIERPVVATITNIDYDHMDVLGKTLTEIASDKMGIIKPGCAFFTAEQRPGLQRLFKKTCATVGAEFNAVPHQPNHSSYNAELVRAIGRHIELAEADIEKGISRARLPCRFEVVQDKPLIILDGAHNRAKIRSTMTNLSRPDIQARFERGGKLHLIVAIADTHKEKKRILEPLLSTGWPTWLVLTQVRGVDRMSVSPMTLVATARRYMKAKGPIEVIESPSKALEAVLHDAVKDDVILIVGSFFLAGELRKKWYPEEWVMRHRRSF